MLKNSVRSLLHRTVYSFYLTQLSKRAVETRIAGIPLSIWPSVMHPGLFRSGKFFAEYLLTQNLDGKYVLDMGTGSGILALAAAKKGATVTAIDKNKAAVRCAKDNALKNGLAGRVTVLEGDFFSGVEKENKFDVILFNPPFLAGAPKNEFEHALYAGNDLCLLDPFVADVKSYLHPGGFTLIALSSDANIPLILDKFQDHGLTPTQIYGQKYFFETLYLFKLA